MRKNQKWWILFAMTTSISMIFTDITILPIALPTMQKLLGLSEIGMQWIINSYTLALAIFVLAAGRFGDILGYRRVFFMGLILFPFGSALCALASSEWQLVLFRFIQGIGGAMLIPNGSSIIYTSFPPNERGKAMGLFVSFGSIFLALGPFLGGVITQYLNWRLIFWVNVPIALLGIFLTRFSVPSFPGHRKAFDWFGFSTIGFGIACIVIGLMQVEFWGWLSPLTIGLLFTGLLLITLLIRFDRETTEPFLDKKLFTNRNYIGALLSILLVQFVLMSTVYFVIYFQNILGFSPAKAGAISLISNSAVMFSAPLAGSMQDRFGPRVPITFGFLLMAGSLLYFIHILGDPSVGKILLSFFPFSFSISFIFTPGFIFAMGQVPPEKRGTASGTSTMMRQFGGTLGLAIFTSIFIALQNRSLTESLQRNEQTVGLKPQALEGLLSKAPAALETIKPFSAETKNYLMMVAKNAFMTGFHTILIVSFFIPFAGLAFFHLLARKPSSPAK